MAKGMKVRKDDTSSLPEERTAARPAGAEDRPVEAAVYVEGLNIVKRHERPARSKTVREAPRRAGSSRKRDRFTSPT